MMRKINLHDHFNSLNKSTKLTFVQKSNDKSLLIEETFKVR